jgi:hypothetical protein
MFGQKILSQASWQQRVEYALIVQLDDAANILRGNETILYQNNSPDTLREIYIHLWPNAYKNNETAFAKQAIENGQTDFYYANEEDRGYIDSLQFLVNWVAVEWSLTEHIDIARIKLKQPLLPNEAIRIATTFKVKLPKIFSRMGHQNQLYCITQWYPKPAVYDINGWNHMPYLDQGEFYSEFGKFEVHITVPQNYVVAATGRLQQPEEKNWLWEKSNEKFGSKTKAAAEVKPNSLTKTLTYIQDSIHDFAWFASKNFEMERSIVKLPSGRQVNTWVYQISPRESIVHFVDSAIQHYSNWLGEYPYSDVSVCVTPLVSGAGMEYPMITNITEVNKQVIVHEVGHNWLYGILANNERNYPWMDESINSYYEALELRYLITARKNEDQAAFSHSEAFTNFNYGAIIYGKASTAFHYLQHYLGDTLFDNMMRSYYENWKFKHPLPDDFINHVKTHTGKELNWFFTGWMNSNKKQDWRITKLKKRNNSTEVFIENKSIIAAPVNVIAFRKGAPIETHWLEGFTGTQSVTFITDSADFFRVDGYDYGIDINRKNNTIRTSGVFKKWAPHSFSLGISPENLHQHKVLFVPFAGANLYNKTMLGMAFYNNSKQNQFIDYTIAPIYSFGAKNIAGGGEVIKYFLSDGMTKRTGIGLGVQQFASSYFTPITYTKFQLFVSAELKQKNPRTDPIQIARLKTIWIDERTASQQIFEGNPIQIIEMQFATNQSRVLQPFNYKIMYQFIAMTNNAHKLNATYKHFINYNQTQKGFSVRVFAGTFLNSFTANSADGRIVYRVGSNTGINDYSYSQSQMGRGEVPAFSNSLFAQQLLFGELEFKELAPAFSTDRWATAINIETTVPGILPVVFYADIALLNANLGFIDGNTNTWVSMYEPRFIYTAGVSFKYKEVFRINFPLVASPIISDYFAAEGSFSGSTPKRYTERISFSLNLNALHRFL